MSTWEHNKRVQILHGHQHLLLHDLASYAFSSPSAPGVTNAFDAFNYILAVLYPSSKGQVATPADLPAAGNTIHDFYTVLDDGDGKASGYRWEQYEGEAAPSWKKVYDFDWGSGTIISHFIQQTQDLFVIRNGASSRDASGNIIAGTFAGQRIYGGEVAGENLTLAANSGDGAGPTTGFVQVEDNFRPTADSTFSSGTNTERWLRSYQDGATIGTLALDDDGVNNEFDFITSRPTINFGSSNLTTTGSGTFSDTNITGLSTWINGVNASVTAQLQGISQVHQETGDPNGVVDKTDITISYDINTRTVTLTGTFEIYCVGKRYTKTGPITATHANTTGTHFFYFNSAGTFVTSMTPWDIPTTVQIVIVAYNNTAATTFWAGPDAILLDERHGIAMDGQTHQSQHYITGTYVRGNGFVLSGTYSVATGTGGAGPNTYGIDGGTIVDEDNEAVLGNFTEGDGTATVYPIFYRAGLGGEWRWVMGAYPYLRTGSNFAYNLNTAGTWSLPEITSNGRYMNMYICAIPFHSSASGNNYRFIWIMGQALHTSLALAQGESFLSLDLAGLPFQEFVPLWQITMRREVSYDNTAGNARIEATTRIVGTRASLATLGTTPSNHNALSNRSDANSHPALAIGLDTSTFTDATIDHLTATETSVQLALEKLSALRASMNVDNMFFFNNSITVTNTDGSLNLVTNGTGSVNVWGPFLPHVDNTSDLGATALRFQDLFLSGTISDGTNSISMTTLLSLRGVTTGADVGDVLIWNGTQWVADVADTEVKHELISGLHSGASVPSTNPDAGHPQFVLLAGRSGGQTIQGGTAASENLLLESTANATKGFIAAKDNFVPNTNAAYSGGWLGTDLGDATHIWRDLYMTGEAKGFRFENVGSTQAFSGQTPGRAWWNTSSNKLEINTGSSVISVGGGGGGASLTWHNDDTVAAEEVTYNNQKAYKFTKGTGQKIHAAFKVPNGYQAGDQLLLRLGLGGDTTTNEVSLKITVDLQGTGTMVSPEDSATDTADITIVAANKIYTTALDLTNASGEVNATSVSADDILLLTIETNDANFDNTGAMYIIPSTSEVYYA